MRECAFQFRAPVPDFDDQYAGRGQPFRGVSENAAHHVESVVSGG
jgi:hypothetical protein